MKKCNECGYKLHGKSKKCKNCKSVDLKELGKFEIEDWTTLKRGNKIHISGGPYMEVNGNKHYHTSNGEYIVVRLVDDGIFARKERGYETDFFYMGEERIAKTGSILSPHTVKVEIS